MAGVVEVVEVVDVVVVVDGGVTDEVGAVVVV